MQSAHRREYGTLILIVGIAVVLVVVSLALGSPAR